MGRTHVISGVLAGEVVMLPFSPGREALWPGVAPVLSWEAAVLFVIVTGASALLPDFDHPSATVARSLGPVTRWPARCVHSAALSIYHATRGPRDHRERRSGHRLITHTPVGCVALASLVAVPLVAHPVAGAVALGALACLAARSLQAGDSVTAGVARRVTRATGATPAVTFAVAGGFAWWVTAVRHPGLWWLWAVAVALGCLTHREGDWLTDGGVPRHSWPVMMAGRRWDTHRSPFPFSAGDATETGVVSPLLSLGVVAVGVAATGYAPVVLSWVASVT